ncbi:MAG: hypothetical protein RLZZ591_1778 [Pseudomonadota bacterium]|jgi:DNA-binding transcriptional MocR family regulator
MNTTRHQALVDAMSTAIRAGRWPAGSRLPTHRAFAREHGVALATASKVYATLQEMALVAGETGRGTYVREWPSGADHSLHAAMPQTAPVDLAFTYPHTPDAGTLLASAWQALTDAGELAALMEVQPLAGAWQHRDAVARHLRNRGLAVDADQVMLVGGAQQGLACTVMSLLQPGDVMVVDDMSYPGMLALGQTHMLDIQALRWHPQGGPDLQALAELLRRRPVRAIYTMPTLHNPTGWVMSEPDRQALVALAREHKVWLIEDAAYAFLVSNAPAPLAALAPERTVYVSSLSKSVGGGVRLGFMVVPPQLAPRFERSLRALTWSQPSLNAALATHWIVSGEVLRLEEAKRDAARQRQALAQTCLSGLRLQANPESFFVWVHLPEAVRPEPLTLRLADLGIAVAPATAFAAGPHAPRAIRLSLGAASMETLQRALPLVRMTIDELAYE